MYKLGVTCDLFPVLRIYDPSKEDHLIASFILLNKKKEHRMDRNKKFTIVLTAKRKDLNLNCPNK
jgi:hypothetical protein